MMALPGESISSSNLILVPGRNSPECKYCTYQKNRRIHNIT
jgi:hypothetical protein